MGSCLLWPPPFDIHDSHTAFFLYQWAPPFLIDPFVRRAATWYTNHFPLANPGLSIQHAPAFVFHKTARHTIANSHTAPPCNRVCLPLFISTQSRQQIPQTNLGSVVPALYKIVICIQELPRLQPYLSVSACCCIYTGPSYASKSPNHSPAQCASWILRGRRMTPQCRHPHARCSGLTSPNSQVGVTQWKCFFVLA